MRIKVAVASWLLVSNCFGSVKFLNDSYDGVSSMTFFMQSGPVQESTQDLMRKLYPGNEVIFVGPVTGHIPSDLKLTNTDVNGVAMDALAGLGLSACIYENNVIVVKRFTRSGACGVERTAMGNRPRIQKYGRGLLSLTDQWYGNFNDEKLILQTGVPALVSSGKAKAERIDEVAASRKLTNTQSTQNDQMVVSTPKSTPLENTSELTAKVESEQASEPESYNVSFVMNKGALQAQIQALAELLPGSPDIVWNLDENEQWFSETELNMPSYEHILAAVLESYDAVADWHLNNVIVIGRS